MINRRSFLSLGGLALVPSRLFAFVAGQREPDEVVDLTQETGHEKFTFSIRRYGEEFRVFFKKDNQSDIELIDYRGSEGWEYFIYHNAYIGLKIRFQWGRTPERQSLWRIDFYRVEFYHPELFKVDVK